MSTTYATHSYIFSDMTSEWTLLAGSNSYVRNKYSRDTWAVLYFLSFYNPFPLFPSFALASSYATLFIPVFCSTCVCSLSLDATILPTLFIILRFYGYIFLTDIFSFLKYLTSFPSGSFDKHSTCQIRRHLSRSPAMTVHVPLSCDKQITLARLFFSCPSQYHSPKRHWTRYSSEHGLLSTHLSIHSDLSLIRNALFSFFRPLWRLTVNESVHTRSVSL